MSESTPSPDETSRTSSPPASQDAEEIVLETKPTVKPTAIRLGITFFVGIVLIAFFLLNPELLGNAETTNVGLLIVQILLVVAVVRLLIRIVVLRRTTYTVTPTEVRREYELLLHRQSRVVPLDLVRSVQFNQSPVQNVLGYGSVAVNQGLGELRLPNLPAPTEMVQTIREHVEDAPERLSEL